MGDLFPGELCLSYGDAPYDIHMEAKSVGKDILVVVTGGTRAHIGAVALAEPAGAAHPLTGERAGRGTPVTWTQGDGSSVLTQGGGSSVLTQGDGSSVSALSGFGHKDAVLAEMFARGFCEKYGVNVCACAGVHVDDASAADIELLLGNAEKLLAQLPEILPEI